MDTIIGGAGADAITVNVDGTGAVTVTDAANPATVDVSGLDIYTLAEGNTVQLLTAASGALTFTAYTENGAMDVEAAVNASGGASALGASGLVKTYTGTYSNGVFTTGAQATTADMLVVFDTDGTGGGTTYQAVVLVGVDNVTVSTAGLITALAAV